MRNYGDLPPQHWNGGAVTVALNGDGGNEGFGGYEVQAELQDRDALAHLPGGGAGTGASS